MCKKEEGVSWFLRQARTKSLRERSLHPMRKVTPITEQFQHFVRDLKESFWGDLKGKAQAAMKHLLEEESRRQRDRYVCREAYERGEGRKEYRNGYYERDFVTRFGTLRLRIARTRGRAVLAAGGRVGRVIAIVTGEAVSAQTGRRAGARPRATSPAC